MKKFLITITVMMLIACQNEVTTEPRLDPMPQQNQWKTCKFIRILPSYFYFTTYDTTYSEYHQKVDSIKVKPQEDSVYYKIYGQTFLEKGVVFKNMIQYR